MTAINEVTDLTLEGDIAVLTLNSPPVNALSAPVRDGIFKGIGEAVANPATRAIVLICQGQTFIAGADISEFGKPPKGASLFDAQAAIENARVPVIAAIHGTALGGGLEVALTCHYRVAVPSAKCGLPEVKLGLLPGAGGTQRLTRAMGKSKAMELCLTGRMMEAAEAERCGLVSRIVPADDLMDAARDLARTIAGMPRVAAMMTKEAINAAFETPLAQGIRFERRLFHSLFATDDQKEGMKAYLDKRTAHFKDR